MIEAWRAQRRAAEQAAFPGTKGLHGPSPTLMNSVETFAHIPHRDHGARCANAQRSFREPVHP